MACGSGTLHDPRNETADAGRHGFPDSCGIGVSAGYGIVDCIADSAAAVSYTHLRAHETDSYLVCRLLLEKKKKTKSIK